MKVFNLGVGRVGWTLGLKVLVSDLTEYSS